MWKVSSFLVNGKFTQGKAMGHKKAWRWKNEKAYPAYEKNREC